MRETGMRVHEINEEEPWPRRRPRADADLFWPTALAGVLVFWVLASPADRQAGPEPPGDVARHLAEARAEVGELRREVDDLRRAVGGLGGAPPAGWDEAVADLAREASEVGAALGEVDAAVAAAAGALEHAGAARWDADRRERPDWWDDADREAAAVLDLPAPRP